MKYDRLTRASKLCAKCGGPLDPTDFGGYVHLNDEDDSHVPVDPDIRRAGFPRFQERRLIRRMREHGIRFFITRPETGKY